MKLIQSFIVSILFLSLFIAITVSGSVISVKDSCVTNSGYEILTPKPGSQPHINSSLVYGCRPGNPFLYRIPCQGKRPIRFSVKGLPDGLCLDRETGIISGTNPPEGEYQMVIEAKNETGKDKRDFRIISGDKLALTPPMGWNHWYANYYRITDKMVREAADIMISSGMADVGYQYVNLDDCWMNASAETQRNKDTTRYGPFRDESGNILPNRHFPDMKALTGYIHSKGLKAGLYTSPGTLTCQGYAGSWQHEEQDARQFAAWRFDFLKYDWCSYRKIVGDDKSLEMYQKPYRPMGTILKTVGRDMIFNICQYGMGEVWKWGAEVGAQCWRTANDLGYELDRVFDVALQNCEYREYSKPGEWNDPDYIQIGWIGQVRKRGMPELTTMPANMQYAYMSLWCLMASPLIYSGDMSKLDEFTLNILCNPEVIDVDQDTLGECGLVIKQDDKHFLIVKNLHDGSKALGFFNRQENDSEMNISWETLKLSGSQIVRDLWRQSDIGSFDNSFGTTVPAQGVVMLKIIKEK